jgi:bacillithiol biosynthesis deacetylase BshB1
MKVDVLAIGAHPDDIELACGGTIALLVKQGYTVGLADLTRGELGTRGSDTIRAKEADQAAKVFRAVTRRNLNIPDGNIEVNQSNIIKVITLIRELQPKLMLIPHSVERHPDHVHAHHLCKEAWFYSGLTKISTKLNGKKQAPHRPENWYEFMQWHQFQPSFIVDISETFETKMKAIRSHASQFHNPTSREPETVLSTPEFLEQIEADSRHFGIRIGVKYGEPFYSYAPVGIKSFFDLTMKKG